MAQFSILEPNKLNSQSRFFTKTLEMPFKLSMFFQRSIFNFDFSSQCSICSICLWFQCDLVHFNSQFWENSSILNLHEGPHGVLQSAIWPPNKLQSAIWPLNWLQSAIGPNCSQFCNLNPKFAAICNLAPETVPKKAAIYNLTPTLNLAILQSGVLKKLQSTIWPPKKNLQSGPEKAAICHQKLIRGVREDVDPWHVYWVSRSNQI